MKLLFNDLKNNTLPKAVFKSFLWTGFVVFIITVITSFVILYSVEDIFLEKTLLESRAEFKNNNSLPVNVEFYASDQVTGHLRGLLESPEGSLIEFSENGESFHALRVTSDSMDGWLLIDASNSSIISKFIVDILSLFMLLFALMAPLYWYFSKRLTTNVLKPFQILMKQIENENYDANEVGSMIYLDVQKVSRHLLNTISERKKLLEENIVFNQGISHELRTPLQIIENSIDIIKQESPNISNSRSLQRLVDANYKLKQLVFSFLWLSSNERYDGRSCVNNIAERLLAVYKKSALRSEIELKLENNNNCSFAAPTEVIEVVIDNILKNAVSYCESPSEITVMIDEKGITVMNTIGAVNSSNDSFGLGLSIVRRLSERFDLSFSIESDNYIYKAKLQALGSFK